MALVQPEEQLPCGVELGALVDQVAEGRPPKDSVHEGRCAHCQAALAELGPLWGRVRELAREEVVAPAALVAAVMRSVHAEGGANGGATLPLRDLIPRFLEHALLPGDRGTLKIADSVLALIVGREALAVRGVLELDSGVSSLPGGSSGVELVVDDRVVSARLRLVVELGCSIPDLLARVRRRVEMAVLHMAGLETGSIDITVTDVRSGGGW